MSRRLEYLLAAAFLAPPAAQAAFELDGVEAWLPFPARGAAAGNPAELATTQCATWALSHYLPFGLPELSRSGLSLAVPCGRAGLVAGLASEGFALHRELTARLGAGLPLSRAIALGAAGSILALRQQGGPPRRGFSLTMGIQLKVGRDLRLGAWWRRDPPELALPRLWLQLQRRTGESAEIYAHLRPGPPTRLDLAAERQLSQQVRLLVGTRSSPRRFGLGATIATGRWRVDFAAKTHAHLGLSHAVAARTTCRCP